MKRKPYKSYLLGYVVYYEQDGIQGDNTFYLEERIYQNSAPIKVEEPYYDSTPNNFECGVKTVFKTERIFKENRTKVFPTLEKAIKAAKSLRKDSNIKSPIFVRMYEYSTNIPEHAKGLKPFPKTGQTVWEIK